MEKKVKWYYHLWLWMLPTQIEVDKSTKKGIELTTTMYYKVVGDVYYIVKTTYSTRQIKGRVARKFRRGNR